MYATCIPVLGIFDDLRGFQAIDPDRSGINKSPKYAPPLLVFSAFYDPLKKKLS